jgi:hypothetical protein
VGEASIHVLTTRPGHLYRAEAGVDLAFSDEVLGDAGDPQSVRPLRAKVRSARAVAMLPGLIRSTSGDRRHLGVRHRQLQLVWSLTSRACATLATLRPSASRSGTSPPNCAGSLVVPCGLRLAALTASWCQTPGSRSADAAEPGTHQSTRPDTVRFGSVRECDRAGVASVFTRRFGS